MDPKHVNNRHVPGWHRILSLTASIHRITADMHRYWRVLLSPESLFCATIIFTTLTGAQGFVPCLGRIDCAAGRNNYCIHSHPSSTRNRLDHSRDDARSSWRRRSRGGGRGAGALHMMNTPTKKNKGAYKVIANNKRARRNYEVLDKFEAGIELLGSEVKSCRLSKINMDDGFAQAKNGQCFLHGVHIAECGTTNRFDQHEPKRARRLLLHKREIKTLEDKVGQKGMTVVPLKIFFNDDNRLKVEIALAQGKNVRDKRDDIKDRDAKRDLQRMTKNAY